MKKAQTGGLCVIAVKYCKDGRLMVSACPSSMALVRAGCVSSDSKENMDKGLANTGARLDLS